MFHKIILLPIALGNYGIGSFFRYFINNFSEFAYWQIAMVKAIIRWNNDKLSKNGDNINKKTKAAWF
jgi:hypothetical protein